MILSRVILIRQAGEIEMLLGALYMALAALIPLFAWHFNHVAKLTWKQEQQQARRELSRRYNLRRTEPG